MEISLIVPCYNEQESIPVFYNETIKVINRLEVSYEMIFVNDGSEDNTIDEIKKISNLDENVKYLSFSKNFGKEAAMYAGFCNAKGDFVSVIDADLQDPPEMLEKMYSIIQSGEYDSVATRRVSRKGEPKIRSWFARRFYKLINLVSDAEIVDGARDYRLMKKDMVEAIVKMTEYNRFSKGIFGWLGYRTYWLEYENIERKVGETKWSFWKLVKYAIDGIVNFSEAPLKIASWFGVIMTIIAFFFLIFIIVRRLVFGDPVAGWASTVCIILFIGGVQLFSLGIMGQYIAKTYSETKHRPHYIIDEANFETEKVN